MLVVRISAIVVLGLLVALAAPFSAKAETITGIEIVGNKRVEESTVLSFIGIAPGDDVGEPEINKALEEAYKTGLFADVVLSVEGETLVVRLVENPVINKVAYEGNRRIKDDALTRETTMKPRDVYTKSDVQADVKRIQDIYLRSGRFAVEVVPKVIQLPENRVNLVFEIDEGDKTTIGNIVFIGNGAFGDDRLRSVIRTKETRWWDILTTEDTYDPDRIAFDQELLRRYYVARGYADFRVISANASLDPQTNNFVITYSLDEGDHYTFGNVKVESAIKDLPTEELAALVLTEEGEEFDAEKVEKSIERITDRAGDLGYAFVKVNPTYARDADNNVLGVSYQVEEGPRVYVDNINIEGNVRTIDEVIRREFRFAEGDPFNNSQLKRSEQRINGLDFFQSVKIDTEQGSAPDRVDINVDVEEKSTGELTFGAGVSSTDGVLGDISISERNLLGRGQFLRLNFTISSARQEVDLGFTEPYFLDREIAAGFDLFSMTRDGDSSTTARTFDLDTNGITLRAAYPLTEYLTHSVRYSFRQDNITDVDANASSYIKLQAGKNSTSLVGHSFIFDKRDNRFNPTEGYFVRLNQDIAGLGGDAHFIRHELRAGYFYSVFDDEVVLKLLGRAGNILGISDDVRVNDRFFIGSDEIRGFKNDGVGPRDSISDDPLGGNTYATATAEVEFPLGLPEELGVKGAVFMDAGTLFGNDDDDSATAGSVVSNILDERSLRLSTGAGIGWASPFGPVRVDFGWAVAKEDFDETELVRFSFGTRF